MKAGGCLVPSRTRPYWKWKVGGLPPKWNRVESKVRVRLLVESLEEVVSAFAELPDTRSRLAKLIAWGKELPAMPEADKQDEFRVPGCLSTVYIQVELHDGLLLFRGDSDTLLVKGLVALLVKGLSYLTPKQVVELSPEFIFDTGIKQSLVPGRANGFRNIFLKMQELAKDFL